MIARAQEIIPGGVQHNLAFNYPFPLVLRARKIIRLSTLTATSIMIFCSQGGPTVLGSNPEAVKSKVIEHLETCGPSTGLFHEYEYLLGAKITECIPSVDMFRMYTGY